MREGGFPVRAARCLSLLLYSPAQDGKHIKCFPLRAELATDLTVDRPHNGPLLEDDAHNISKTNK